MSPKQHGPWIINDSTVKYRHELLQLREDQVTRPDGTPGVYATVRVKAGVAVLALDEEGFVYLAQEFRYAVGRESLEVVGGAIEEGEAPTDAARRELKEELGIAAEELIELGKVDPMTSLIDSPAHLFLARGIKLGEMKPEGSERIERVRLPLAEAALLVHAGTITHGASCVLILRAQHFLHIAADEDGDE